jgi:hypothetical protein
MLGAGAISAPGRARRTRKNRWQKSILPAASATRRRARRAVDERFAGAVAA